MRVEPAHDGRTEDAPPPRRDFWPEASELIQADTRASLDIVVRWSVITVGALALWYAMAAPLPLIWAMSYIVIDASYVSIMRRWRPPVRLPGYMMIMAMNIVTSSAFAVMPYYLITTDQLGLTFAGLCGFLGTCVHNLVRHRGLTHVAVWDVILMGIGAALVAWVFVRNAASTGEAVLILTGVVGLSVYFGVAYMGSLHIRGRLNKAEMIRAEAQKMEAVGRLTGGVAHDFNNILTVILGNLDLYEELDHPGERDSVVREAQVAANRAATLTAQLLSFSGRATLRPEPIEIAEFLDGMGTMYRRILPATITLIMDAGPPGLTCRADPNQLSTALLNLVINARDAMPEGGHISVTARPRKLPYPQAPHRSDGRRLSGRFCAIAVRDNGPGIPEARLEEVKAPFFTTKPLGKGSGLGLSMVVGFAEQTEGALSLRNRPEGGLEATLVLPQADRDATVPLTDASDMAE
ncbi:ATP-binding protein [Rhodophyticola porphyridii]|uniref:ATP-binding protein n=1 Tax=Rhodophyticola porphyridii TaxID=1852017 RepID=UPI0035CEAB44